MDRRGLGGHFGAAETRGAAAPIPEDGCHRQARGGDRARFQQPSHGHHRLWEPPAGSERRPSPGAQVRREPPEGLGGGLPADPGAPDPEPQAGAHTQAGGSQRDHRQDRKLDGEDHRREVRVQRLPRTRAGHGSRRCQPAGADAPESGDQCPGRDARWRQARHLGQPLFLCTRPGKRGQGVREVRRAFRHGQWPWNRRGHSAADLRALLHDEGGRPGHGARALHRLGDREAAQRRNQRVQRAGEWDDLQSLPALHRRDAGRGAGGSGREDPGRGGTDPPGRG